MKTKKKKTNDDHKQKILPAPPLRKGITRFFPFKLFKSPDNPEDKIDSRVYPIAASSFMMGTAMGVIIPIMPLFAREIGISTVEFGLVISVMGLTRLLCNVPAAWASEHFGRKPLLVAGPILGAISMTGTALATSFKELLAYRFVTGAGGSMQMSAAQLYLADISTVKNRARTMAPMIAAFSAGAALGPGIGGYMADTLGLNAPFFFVGGAMLLVALNNFYSLTETLQRKTTKKKRKLVEEFKHMAKQWRPLLKSKDIQSALLSHGMYWFTASGITFTLMPLLAVDKLGMSGSGIGMLFALTSIITVIGSQPAAKISDRFGRKFVVVPAAVLCASAIALMPFMQTPLHLTGLITLWAVGSTLQGTAPMAYVSDLTTSETRSQALALLRSAGDVGLLLGASVVGLTAALTNFDVAMLGTSVAMALSGVHFAFRAKETVTQAKK